MKSYSDNPTTLLQSESLKTRLKLQGLDHGLTKAHSKKNTKAIFKILKLAEPEFQKNKNTIMFDVAQKVICAFDQETLKPTTEYSLDKNGKLIKQDLTGVNLHQDAKGIH